MDQSNFRKRRTTNRKNIEQASRLRAAMDDLIREMPASKAGQIAFLWPQIEVALKRGHKPKFIWTKLNSAGLNMPLTEFRVYVARARKKAEKDPPRMQQVSWSTKGVAAEIAGLGEASESRVPANSGGALDPNARDALQLLKEKGPQWPGTPKKVKDLL